MGKQNTFTRFDLKKKNENKKSVHRDTCVDPYLTTMGKIK